MRCIKLTKSIVLTKKSSLVDRMPDMWWAIYQQYKNKVRPKANNYKSMQENFRNKKAVPNQVLKHNVFINITVQIDVMT